MHYLKDRNKVRSLRDEVTMELSKESGRIDNLDSECRCERQNKGGTVMDHLILNIRNPPGLNVR